MDFAKSMRARGCQNLTWPGWEEQSPPSWTVRGVVWRGGYWGMRVVLTGNKLPGWGYEVHLRGLMGPLGARRMFSGVCLSVVFLGAVFGQGVVHRSARLNPRAIDAPRTRHDIESA